MTREAGANWRCMAAESHFVDRPDDLSPTVRVVVKSRAGELQLSVYQMLQLPAEVATRAAFQ
jgi:hypothetical protein